MGSGRYISNNAGYCDLRQWGKERTTPNLVSGVLQFVLEVQYDDRCCGASSKLIPEVDIGDGEDDNDGEVIKIMLVMVKMVYRQLIVRNYFSGNFQN